MDLKCGDADVMLPARRHIMIITIIIISIAADGRPLGQQRRIHSFLVQGITRPQEGRLVVGADELLDSRRPNRLDCTEIAQLMQKLLLSVSATFP